MTYAEALRLPWETPGAKLLGRRQPLANLASHYADENTGWTFDRRGEISGWCDIWEPAGEGGGPALEGEITDVTGHQIRQAHGTSAPAGPGRSTASAAHAECFEPLHWRTFRFVGLRIETGAQPLALHALRYRFTGYPYRIAAEFTCSDHRMDQIWRVALRTMRLCSHETFEDCPYYEQMQYAGDTMITSKIGMLASGDYRLARQALFHFDWSRVSDGLTQSRYPSRLVQIIPSWSLHWITNIRDYAFCSGDLETVRDLLPGVRAVLDWFRRHGDADGLPAQLPFWNIADWCPWWPRGVVPGADSGPTCIISAQYIVAMDEAAVLCRVVGYEKEADELAAAAEALRPKLRARFWSEAEGLFFDRPGGPEMSQYGNAWAILCGAAAEPERKRMLARFPHDPKLAPGSFFWWHAGFRALALAGGYDRMPDYLGPWHEMIEHGLSTFAEENSYWRSLCHAWSAHPALEFLTGVLGVTPRTPGFAAIDIAPHCCGLAQARGKVCTPRGTVDVAWESGKGRFKIEIDAPDATPVHVRLPNGERRQFEGGKFSAEVRR
jgi:alpha-L-rhamnosidase